MGMFFSLSLGRCPSMTHAGSPKLPCPGAVCYRNVRLVTVYQGRFQAASTGAGCAAGRASSATACFGHDEGGQAFDPLGDLLRRQVAGGDPELMTAAAVEVE